MIFKNKPIPPSKEATIMNFLSKICALFLLNLAGTWEEREKERERLLV